MKGKIIFLKLSNKLAYIVKVREYINGRESNEFLCSIIQSSLRSRTKAEENGKLISFSFLDIKKGRIIESAELNKYNEIVREMKKCSNLSTK